MLKKIRAHLELFKFLYNSFMKKWHDTKLFRQKTRYYLSVSFPIKFLEGTFVSQREPFEMLQLSTSIILVDGA